MTKCAVDAKIHWVNVKIQIIYVICITEMLFSYFKQFKIPPYCLPKVSTFLVQNTII